MPDLTEHGLPWRGLSERSLLKGPWTAFAWLAWALPTLSWPAWA